MKEFTLLAISTIAIFLAGSNVTAPHSIAAPEKQDLESEYTLIFQANKDKTGNLVLWHMMREDEFFVFVTDEKCRPNKPELLCRLNYTSTQGSYNPKWSKDKQMLAVYNESSERGWGAPWVVGYDWKTGKVLKFDEIKAAFSRHGGIGESSRTKGHRAPTAKEVEQYKPERLHR